MNEQHDRSISTAIKKLAGTFTQQKITFDLGNVVSVNADERTCEVGMDNNVTMTCKLMAQVGDGILLVPAVGSDVLVGYFTYDNAFVFMYSDLDTISLKGTELGGLVKVIELTKKLNNLENKVNAIITNFNSHTHAGVTTGPGVSGTTATPVTGALTPTLRTEIENPNVAHGT
jgi:hypothetical protein